ncbi:phosphogluconate dehydrogenase (NAD(+)-dependent, decarboxylating) [Rhodococcus opacus]|uniref:phosphogluconate dehydrogenase (NAD(+)-dependent, decarboxylating) n=1 Tax=Rhodococcus opacus TaxID=37919 RepID=UPI000563C8DA|nr:decarboxylating 6-phosphogluconate dehydrogenase [Rhodococcus opacus]
MQIGLIGLGKMGSNMRRRWQEAGIDVVGYDQNADQSDVRSLDELVHALSGPRIVWTMVPAGQATTDTITALAALLDGGDLVIDGGNSPCTDDVDHAQLLAGKSISYLDCGVSGGIWGYENGYGLMVGGDPADVTRAMPLFDALSPPGPRDEGFVHAGPVGAGHFAKMIHNGIEYGLMQAYAEGYELLSAERSITDVTGVLRSWTRGTVVRSWLLDLLVAALDEDPGLETVSGYTEDSGEGRWTIEHALRNAVPVPVISAALFARFGSRQLESPAMKAVSSLRRQFGGHATRTSERPASV